MQSYQKLSTKHRSILMSFAATCLCESGFSSLIYLKNKYRNRLNTSNNLRVALSNCLPRHCVVYWKKHPGVKQKETNAVCKLLKALPSLQLEV